MASDPAPVRLHRRTFLIDRDFQLKYAGLLLLAGLVLSSAFAIAAYLAHVDANAGLVASTAAERSMDPLLIVFFTFAVALAGGAMGLLGLVLTHRVAGPVYVMTHYVTALASGKYLPVRQLRRNDELKGFFERFRLALDQLRSREQEEAATLKDALTTLSSHASHPDAQAALAKLSALHDRKRQAVETPTKGP